MTPKSKDVRAVLETAASLLEDHEGFTDEDRTHAAEDLDAVRDLCAAAPTMRDALEAVLSLIEYADSDGRAFTGDNRTEYTTRVEPMLRAALAAAGGAA